MLVAPAMNNRMYEHPATRANLELLRERGVTMLEPGTGRLASKGEQGIGRMAEPAELLAACERALAAEGVAQLSRAGGNGAAGAPRAAGDGVRHDWSGLRVLVTAGGTREPIDSVRFVGNRSSGRMGAGARAGSASAWSRGHAGGGERRAAGAGGRRAGATSRPPRS